MDLVENIEGMIKRQGKMKVFQEKPAQSLCSPQIPYGVLWGLTQASVVKRL